MEFTKMNYPYADIPEKINNLSHALVDIKRRKPFYKKINLKVLFSSLVVLLLVVGSVAAFTLINSSSDIRQQAMIVNDSGNGSNVQTCTQLGGDASCVSGSSCPSGKVAYAGKCTTGTCCKTPDAAQSATNICVECCVNGQTRKGCGGDLDEAKRNCDSSANIQVGACNFAATQTQVCTPNLIECQKQGDTYKQRKCTSNGTGWQFTGDDASCNNQQTQSSTQQNNVVGSTKTNPKNIAAGARCDVNFCKCTSGPDATITKPAIGVIGVIAKGEKCNVDSSTLTSCPASYFPGNSGARCNQTTQDIKLINIQGGNSCYTCQAKTLVNCYSFTEGCVKRTVYGSSSCPNNYDYYTNQNTCLSELNRNNYRGCYQILSYLDPERATAEGNKCIVVSTDKTISCNRPETGLFEDLSSCSLVLATESRTKYQVTKPNAGACGCICRTQSDGTYFLNVEGMANCTNNESTQHVCREKIDAYRQRIAQNSNQANASDITSIGWEDCQSLRLNINDSSKLCCKKGENYWFLLEIEQDENYANNLCSVVYQGEVVPNDQCTTCRVTLGSALKANKDSCINSGKQWSDATCSCIANSQPISTSDRVGPCCVQEGDTVVYKAFCSRQDKLDEREYFVNNNCSQCPSGSNLDEQSNKCVCNWDRNISFNKGSSLPATCKPPGSQTPIVAAQKPDSQLTPSQKTGVQDKCCLCTFNDNQVISVKGNFISQATCNLNSRGTCMALRSNYFGGVKNVSWGNCQAESKTETAAVKDICCEVSKAGSDKKYYLTMSPEQCSNMYSQIGARGTAVDMSQCSPAISSTSGREQGGRELAQTQNTTTPTTTAPATQTTTATPTDAGSAPTGDASQPSGNTQPPKVEVCQNIGSTLRGVFCDGTMEEVKDSNGKATCECVRKTKVFTFGGSGQGSLSHGYLASTLATDDSNLVTNYQKICGEVNKTYGANKDNYACFADLVFMKKSSDSVVGYEYVNVSENIMKILAVKKDSLNKKVVPRIVLHLSIPQDLTASESAAQIKAIYQGGIGGLDKKLFNDQIIQLSLDLSSNRYNTNDLNKIYTAYKEAQVAAGHKFVAKTPFKLFVYENVKDVVLANSQFIPIDAIGGAVDLAAKQKRTQTVSNTYFGTNVNKNIAGDLGCMIWNAEWVKQLTPAQQLDGVSAAFSTDVFKKYLTNKAGSKSNQYNYQCDYYGVY